MFDNPLSLNLLKRFEGYTAKPKWDHKQYSVGYSTRWTPGTPIGTREDHENALREEAGKVDSYIGQNVKVPLDENKRAALVSFGFNLGPGAIGRLLPDINAGNWDRVGQRMLSFSRAGDNPTALIDRRREEAALLAGGAPASSYMAANAARAVKDNGGPMPSPMPVAGTTGTLPGLPDFGPIPSERRKAMAEALYGQSFRTANSATNPLGALAAIVQAGVGSHLGSKYDDEKASWKRKLAEGLAGAKDNDSLSRMLLASGDDDLVKAAVNLRVAQAKPQTTSDIQEYQFAMKQREELGQTKIPYDVWIKEVKAKQADSGYGTNLYSYKTKDGKNVPFQTSKAGGRLDLQLPEGAEFLPGVELKDIGTAYVPVDKKSGVQAGPAISKDIVGKEAAEEVGKLGGQAQVALPAARTMVDNARKTIAELRAHPGLDVGTGASNVFDPRSWTPGTDAYDFQAKNKQAQGQSFMAARDALKGAGQVTDFEGAKGEQAIANLDAAQSKEQYLSALDNLESMMRASYMDLQRKAAAGRAAAASGGGAPAPAEAPAPVPAAATPSSSAPKTVPPQAIDMLKGNPTPLARQQFDEIFGPGAADRALGPQSSAPTPQELQSAYSMVQ